MCENQAQDTVDRVYLFYGVCKHKGLVLYTRHILAPYISNVVEESDKLSKAYVGGIATYVLKRLLLIKW